MKDVIEPHANLAPLFKDRVVFVGQRSPARHLEEPVDQHKTRAMPPEVQRVMSSYKRTSYSSDQPDASVDAIAKHLKTGFRRF